MAQRCTGCEMWIYEEGSDPCPNCFPGFRYRVIAKSGGVIVHTERTDNLRVVNETVRALIEEGGNEVIVFDNGRPYHITDEPTGNAEIDAILADYFTLEAAVKPAA